MNAREKRGSFADNHTVTTKKSIYRRRGESFIFGQVDGIVDFAIRRGPVPQSWEIVVKAPDKDGPHFGSILLPKPGGTHQTALHALRLIISQVKDAGGVRPFMGMLEKSAEQPTMH
jgi:hypothetical protein